MRIGLTIGTAMIVLSACGSAAAAQSTPAPTVVGGGVTGGNILLTPPPSTPWPTTVPTAVPRQTFAASAAPTPLPAGWTGFSGNGSSSPSQWLGLVQADLGVIDADIEIMLGDLNNNDVPTVIADAQGMVHDIGLIKLDVKPPIPAQYAHATTVLLSAVSELTVACNQSIAGNLTADDIALVITELSQGKYKAAQALGEMT